MSFDHEIHYVDQVLVRYRRHAANRGDDAALMLPGLAAHFGKMLQDTPPRLRHMFPAAKRQFFDCLTRGLLAEGLALDHVGLAQWNALQARWHALEEQHRQLEDHARRLEEHARGIEEHARGIEERGRWLEQHTRWLEERACQREERIRDLAGDLGAALSSWSWRVTAPLRALARGIRRLMQRLRPAQPR
jgi:hypothetical protein